MNKLVKKDEILTLDLLNSFECDSIFASGTFMDSYDDIPLCCPISNKEVKWIALKGMRQKNNGISDWCIYASNPHYSLLDFIDLQIFHGAKEIPDLFWSDEVIKKVGDKISFENNIRKLVPCDDDVFKLYRY